MGALDTAKKIVAGDTAHDAVDAGNPIKIGGKASTVRPTAVAVGDRVNAWFDRNGIQYVSQYAAFSYCHLYPGSITGDSTDILLDRNDGSYAWPLADTITTTGKANEYFQGSNAAMDANRIEFYIPLGEANYRQCEIVISNNLGTALTLQAYLIPANVAFVSTTAIIAGAYRAIGASTSHTIADYVGDSEASRFYISVGHDGDDVAANRISTRAIGGGIYLRVTPGADPSAGEWSMTIMRSR